MQITRLFIIFLLFISLSGIAQVKGGYNEKLAKLYSAGKFESCLFKADNLTYKESTSRDPEPYLYIAMCFYQLSKSSDPIIREDYSDGEKQAVKYAGYFIRKDKEGDMYEDNLEFITMLKELQFAKIKKEFDEEEYRKAGTQCKKYAKLNKEEDFTVSYFIGACEILSRNITTGQRDLDEAKEGLKPLLKSGNLKIDKIFKPLISSIFMKYSEVLIAENRINEALAESKLGLKILPNDGYLKIQSNMIEKKIESSNN